MVDWNRLRNAVEGQDTNDTETDLAELAAADEDSDLLDDAWEDWMQRRNASEAYIHERDEGDQWYRFEDTDPPADADPDEVWIESKALVDPAGLKTGSSGGDA